MEITETLTQFTMWINAWEKIPVLIFPSELCNFEQNFVKVTHFAKWKFRGINSWTVCNVFWKKSFYKMISRKKFKIRPKQSKLAYIHEATKEISVKSNYELYFRSLTVKRFHEKNHNKTKVRSKSAAFSRKLSGPFIAINLSVRHLSSTR